MIKKLIVVLLFTQQVIAQSYAPPAGQVGSTAIHQDSSIIVAWATGCSVTRGYQDISDQSLGFADYGDYMDGIGISNGSHVVSLGDGGSTVVTFDQPIINGSGPDFAVFENGFSETFLELAFVEVSSDGVRFYRFPAVSETQTDTQIGGFGAVDCRYIHNLAGKYKTQHGTPFDLEDLIDSVGLDVNAITHVKIIDVVGSVDAQYGSQDYLGTYINDPFPTPFGSCGFDFDAVGVIHQGYLGVEEMNNVIVNVYPNPTNGLVKIQSNAIGEFVLFDSQGRNVRSGEFNEEFTLNLSSEDNGVYLLKIISNLGVSIQRINKQ